MTYFRAPTSNFWSTTLNGTVDASVTTITLNSTTGLQAPGVLILDREDGNGTATPSARELVSFSGISGSDITGVTRGFANSTARAHSSGALAEAVPDVGAWNGLVDGVRASLTADGTGIALSGTASIATLLPNTLLSGPRGVFTSIASIARAEVVNQTVTSVMSVSQVSFKASKGTLTTDADGATVTFDMNASNYHNVVLGGNRTLAVSNVAVGQSFVLRLTQDGTGSRTVTWFSTISWADSTAPTLTTTASKADTFGFICTGSGTYDGFVVGVNIG